MESGGPRLRLLMEAGVQIGPCEDHPVSRRGSPLSSTGSTPDLSPKPWIMPSGVPKDYTIPQASKDTAFLTRHYSERRIITVHGS
jgi:hypothetical protein